MITENILEILTKYLLTINNYNSFFFLKIFTLIKILIILKICILKA